MKISGFQLSVDKFKQLCFISNLTEFYQEYAFNRQDSIFTSVFCYDVTEKEITDNLEKARDHYCRKKSLTIVRKKISPSTGTEQTPSMSPRSCIIVFSVRPADPEECSEAKLCDLRCLGTPPCFIAIFARGHNSCEFLFASLVS